MSSNLTYLLTSLSLSLQFHDRDIVQPLRRLAEDPASVSAASKQYAETLDTLSVQLSKAKTLLQEVARNRVASATVLPELKLLHTSAEQLIRYPEVFEQYTATKWFHQLRSLLHAVQEYVSTTR